MKVYKIIFAMLVAHLVCLWVPLTAFAQAEKFGIIQYTPPKGWTKTANDNVVALSNRNQSTGNYCIITVYGATTASGKPQSEFAREWNHWVVKPLQAEANPKTDTQSAEGWTIIAGGSSIEFQGSKAFALLTVFTGFGKTVSILGVLNDQAYLGQLAAFISSVELDKPAADSPIPQPRESLPPASAAKPTTMHAAALVKEFETNEVRANQVWNGKRVRIYGTVNNIEVEKDGNIVLTFKSSITTYNQARCFFNKSQSSRIAALNANQEATVEGTVRGLGGGLGNTKSFLLLESCTLP
jgi:hypothetical protein